MDSYQQGLQVAVSSAYANSEFLPQTTAFLYCAHEPLAEVQVKVAATNVDNSSNVSNPENTKKMSQIQNLLENFYNYASSYAWPVSKIRTSATSPVDDQKTWLPLDCLNKWFNMIISKLSTNPNYLRPD